MTQPSWPTLTIQALQNLSVKSLHILTVNNRTAREVVKYFKPTATKVRDLPAISPWSAWLKQQVFDSGFSDTHKELGHVTTVIDAFCSQVLWAQVIESEESERPLLDIYRAAQQASSAQGLLLAWHMSVPDNLQTLEFKQFKIWRDIYLKKLRAACAIDVHQLPHVVEKLIQQGVLRLPKMIVLVGFAEQSPADLAVLSAMAQHGVEVVRLVLPHSEANQISSFSCLGASEEWLRAAHWAREQLTQYPNGRFALIAPTLQTDAPHAKRVLTRVLQDVHSTQHFAFNVAVAPALADWPATRALLAWLGLLMPAHDSRRWSVEQVGETLMLGFCAGHISEASQRALIDSRWRDQEKMDVSHNDWHQALSRLPKLAQAWQSALDVVDSRQKLHASAYEWATLWRKQLSAIGFPGDAKLDSVSYQVVVAIDGLFEKFMALDQVLDAMTASQALGLLGRLARQTPFQPQRDPTARLDVLGLLEAEGGRWDAVWVMGLNDDVLPAAPSPNPFIPLPALISAQAPRATPERERVWAEQLFTALLKAAPKIVLSWPEQSGERQLRPSPFLMPFKPSVLPPQSSQPFQQTPMTVWADDNVPPVTVLENVKGGVGLFETQARNPMWAFFKYRLNVRALKPYALTRPTGEQGDFIHAVLCEVANRYATQAALQATTQLQSKDQIWQDLVAPIAEQKLLDMHPLLRAMHVERALKIVQAWCVFDAQRTPYQVVATEARYPLVLGPLNLSFQIDRVDQLASGGYVVIDYKTGGVPQDLQKEWARSQPIVNQLLTYSIAWQQQHPTVQPIEALVLAQVKPNLIKMVGLTGGDVGIEGLKHYDASQWAAGIQASSHHDQSTDHDWLHGLQGLQHKVVGIANAFIAGDVRNESFSIDDLKYCDIRPLLRLHELDEAASQEVGAVDE